MPVEIKELIIRANIVDNSDATNLNSDEHNLAPQMEKNYEQKDEIIAACVAQVLKILERKKER